jgi:(p)ppGpp synthase/HD superfamily hydrolase
MQMVILKNLRKEKMSDYTKVAEYAEKCHADANCEYGGGESYMVHVNMVVDLVKAYSDVFKNPEDGRCTIKAAYCHDVIEDTKESYNDVSEVIGKDAANVVLAVTDVAGENRLMKHLLTMGKTVLDYRAIILKMCDICANATYSRTHSSSMYKKYVEEFSYRKPIFQKALSWYKDELNQEALNGLWAELSFAHGKEGTYPDLRSSNLTNFQ